MSNLEIFKPDETPLPKVYTPEQRNAKIQALKKAMDENQHQGPSPMEFIKAGLSITKEIGIGNLIKTFLKDPNLLAASVAVHAEERKEAAKLLAEKNQTNHE